MVLYTQKVFVTECALRSFFSYPDPDFLVTFLRSIWICRSVGDGGVDLTGKIIGKSWLPMWKWHNDQTSRQTLIKTAWFNMVLLRWTMIRIVDISQQIRFVGRNPHQKVLRQPKCNHMYIHIRNKKIGRAHRHEVINKSTMSSGEVIISWRRRIISIAFLIRCLLSPSLLLQYRTAYNL